MQRIKNSIFHVCKIGGRYKVVSQRMIVKFAQNLPTQAFTNSYTSVCASGRNQIGGFIHDSAVDMYTPVVRQPGVNIIHVIGLVSVKYTSNRISGIVLSSVGRILQVSSCRCCCFQPAIFSLQPIAVNQRCKNIGHRLIQGAGLITVNQIGSVLGYGMCPFVGNNIKCT